MVDRGVEGKKVRRYRVAVYTQCGSVREVDAAFDTLIETMLSDRREDYLWGVLIDHAPSQLFRTLGDYEIEERTRARFEGICLDYPECGFFCILRGRRYCGNGGFRCEGGMYGAVRILLGGRSDGCAIRLCTGDTVEHSERIFIRDIRGGMLPLLPCDVTRSSLIPDTVAVCGRQPSSTVKKWFSKCLRGDYSGNYRAVGWFNFPFSSNDTVNAYRVFCPERSRRVEKRGDGVNAEKAFDCAKRSFIRAAREGISLSYPKWEADGLAAALFAYVAVGDNMALDAVNLRETLDHITKMIADGGNVVKNGSAGFLRIALLISSAFCDGMGQYGEEYYSLALEMKRRAEDLRVAYESGRRRAVSPFLPCEMLAFRICGEQEARFFGGFTALKRICDCFCYLFSGKREQLCAMLTALLSEGFGECGVPDAEGEGMTRNALLLCVSSELCRGTFSKLAARVPEIRACAPLLSALPLDGTGQCCRRRVAGGEPPQPIIGGG